MNTVWTTHTMAMDGSIVTADVAANPNPDAILAAHAGLPRRPAWFTPADVAVFVAATVHRRPLAVVTFDAYPPHVADAVIRFAFHHELIRQEGQRVTLTRHGRRYLRRYTR